MKRWLTLLPLLLLGCANDPPPPAPQPTAIQSLVAQRSAVVEDIHRGCYNFCDSVNREMDLMVDGHRYRDVISDSRDIINDYLDWCMTMPVEDRDVKTEIKARRTIERINRTWEGL